MFISGDTLSWKQQSVSGTLITSLQFLYNIQCYKI